jgi:hypothetical protein
MPRSQYATARFDTLNVATVFSSWNKGRDDNLILSCTAPFSHSPPTINTKTLCPSAVHNLLSLFLPLHNHKTIYFPMTYILPSLPQPKGYKVTVWKSSWMKFSTRSHPSQMQCLSSCPFISLTFHNRDPSSFHTCSTTYSHAPPNDVSVNDGPHIRWWSHNIIIKYCNTTVLQLPTVFSTVTCYTGF